MNRKLILDILEKENGPTIIGIDGRGGSGKSTLAKILAKKYDAEVIHIDDFASPADLENWHVKLIDSVLTPITTGSTKLSYPRSQWSSDEFRAPVKDQNVASVMILEGVGALKSELRKYIDIALFVDTPQKVCLERGLKRDRSHYPNKTDAEIKQMWNAWITLETEYIKKDAPKEYADFTLDGTKPFKDQLNTINICLK